MSNRILVVAALLAAVMPAIAKSPEKPVTGAKLICFEYSTFSLDVGESVADFAEGREVIGIIVNGPLGAYTIVESSIFAPPARPMRLVYSKGRMSVHRFLDQGVHYAIYGPTRFSGGKERVIVRLSGPGMTGKPSDQSVYSRFEIRDPTGLKCDHTFTYALDF